MPRDIGYGATIEQPGQGGGQRGGGSVDYPLPNLPVTNEGGKPPPYYTNPEQYTPVDYGFPTGKGGDNFNLRNFYEQLIPTSKNVRNRSLQNILQRSQMPLEQVYAGQEADKASQGRAQNIQDLESNAASRGMVNSGPLERAMRGNEVNYIGNLAQAQSAGRDQEVKRQSELAGQLMALVKGDLDFYKYLNAGRNVAVGQPGGGGTSSLGNIAGGATALLAGLFSGGDDSIVSSGTDMYGGGGFNGYGGGASYPVSSGGDSPTSSDIGFSLW